MIEIETSKTGLPIFKSEGRLLSSSYDPIHEAQKWLDNVSQKVQGFDVVFLLGIGSAYHCMALQKMFTKKKILVLETDASLVQKTKELFFDLSKTQVCLISNPRDLLGNQDIMEFTSEIFCTLRLPSTRLVNTSLFDEVETILTGRSSYDFSKFCDHRPNYKRQIDFGKLRTANLISIKDIAGAIRDEGHLLSSERRVVSILEELIR